LGNKSKFPKTDCTLIRPGDRVNRKKDTKKVSVVTCGYYERTRVERSVRRSIDLLGGIGAFVSAGQKVFVKFNLLQGAAPEKCVTTHPEVVYAVAKVLKEHGCDVLLGDSPGSGIPYTKANLQKAYAESGFERIAQELGVPLNYDTGYRDVPAPEGKAMKQFPIINPALDCDAVVVVSKVKTHASLFISAATKNLFGVIPGLEKPTYHARLQDPGSFAEMLLDLNAVVRPKLQIMDAVYGMEGDGPFAGEPRKIGAILASGDYSAIDVAVCRLIAVDPPQSPTIAAAIGRGLLREDLSDVFLSGDNLNDLIVKDFKRPATYKGGLAIRRDPKSQFAQIIALAKEYTLRPVIHGDICVVCLKCVRSCPVKTIALVDNKPVIDYTNCIRCYCCHEMCDSKAITLEHDEAAGRELARLTGV
jgi:uncharacterized protein (DUF362 family)/Pyruvate/2-oxoacid:ferredoxin oxidoreductase delta subunit